MVKKIVFGLLAITTCISTVFGQQVKWIDGILTLGGKPYLTYEITKIGADRIYVYHRLGEESDLFQAHSCSNWSFEGGDGYRHYYFPEAQLELILPLKRRYRFKKLLPIMLERGVIDEEGMLDEPALRKFVGSYHVPIPRRFGPRVHELPVIQDEKDKSHKWKYSEEYDPEKKKWKEE